MERFLFLLNTFLFEYRFIALKWSRLWDYSLIRIKALESSLFHLRTITRLCELMEAKSLNVSLLETSAAVQSTDLSHKYRRGWEWPHDFGSMQQAIERTEFLTCSFGPSTVGALSIAVGPSSSMSFPVASQLATLYTHSVTVLKARLSSVSSGLSNQLT